MKTSAGFANSSAVFDNDSESQDDVIFLQHTGRLTQLQARTYIHQYTIFRVCVYRHNVQALKQVIGIYMREQSMNHISLEK